MEDNNMDATVFNPVQLHLLKMLAYDDSEERLSKVKEVLAKHFFRKLDESLNRAWESGVLSQERLDELRKVDVRKVELDVGDYPHLSV